MKLISLVFAFLLAPEAMATELPCGAVWQQNSGDSVFLLGPYLQTTNRNGGSMNLPFAYAGTFAGANFSENLCRACGWGKEGTALTFGRFTAPYVAYLTPEGKLERLGRSTEGSAGLGEIDSLTCRQ